MKQLEITEVFSDDEGPLTTVFHYRIEKEAGENSDSFPTESFASHCRVIIKHKYEIDYNRFHIAQRNELADSYNIPRKHITPISEKEYSLETN